jgi:hypothetical protein
MPSLSARRFQQIGTDKDHGTSGWLWLLAFTACGRQLVRTP